MEIILNNPYRVTGLLAGATAKEQNRQIKRLKQYISAGQKPESDFSFRVLGDLDRTLNNIDEAIAKLNLNDDKLNAALFWFWNGNPITDEVAFDTLRNIELSEAVNIWEKLIYGEVGPSNPSFNPMFGPVHEIKELKISRRNVSAYTNLSTLYLSGILDGTEKGVVILDRAISLKLKFLESDFVNDFILSSTDKFYKITSKELQISFLNQLQLEIEKEKKFSLGDFLTILNNHEFVAKEDFLKSFTQKPMEQIKQKIEIAKNKRKSNKADAAKAGKELFTITINDLEQLNDFRLEAERFSFG